VQAYLSPSELTHEAHPPLLELPPPPVRRGAIVEAGLVVRMAKTKLIVFEFETQNR
jgi:hypothetical protein